MKRKYILNLEEPLPRRQTMRWDELCEKVLYAAIDECGEDDGACIRAAIRSTLKDKNLCISLIADFHNNERTFLIENCETLERYELKLKGVK